MKTIIDKDGNEIPREKSSDPTSEAFSDGTDRDHRPDAARDIFREKIRGHRKHCSRGRGRSFHESGETDNVAVGRLYDQEKRFRDENAASAFHLQQRLMS